MSLLLSFKIKSYAYICGSQKSSKNKHAPPPRPLDIEANVFQIT